MYYIIIIMQHLGAYVIYIYYCVKLKYKLLFNLYILHVYFIFIFVVEVYRMSISKIQNCTRKIINLNFVKIN